MVGNAGGRMKTEKKMTKTFVYAAAIAVITLAPITAAAHDNGYNHRHQSNGDQQLVGGVIGAIAGGVIGSQVAANGARTEGSVLGAVIGGAAGAAIAGSNNNHRSRTYGGRVHYNTGYSGGYYRQPTYTTTYQTQPTYYQPRPTYYQPQPTYYPSQPVYYQPRPTYYTAPTYTYSQPYYRPRTSVNVTIGSTHNGYRRSNHNHYRAHNRRNNRHNRRYGH